MIELEERLRAELARSAGVARPAPDPLGRLLTRRRRQRQRRRGALVVMVLLAMAGATLITVSSRRASVPADPAPDPRPAPMTAEITSPWTRQLLAAPTRGNLAGDSALIAELARQLSRNQRHWDVDPALNQVKILLLADVAGARVFAASYYNDTHAVYVSSSGYADTSPADLAAGEFGGGVEPLQPFLAEGSSAAPTGRPSYSYVTALAPPGCQIATSNEARFNADATVTRTWVDHGDYLVQAGEDTYWWRFTCAGAVRDIQTGSTLRPTPATLAGPPVTERGHADPALVRNAIANWYSLPGLAVNRYRALWGGTVAGTTTPVVVVIGESPGGVQVCAVTGTGNATPTYAVANGALDSRRADRQPAPNTVPSAGPRTVVTTALAASADLVTVRLPDPDRPFVLSDRLLVIAPAAATELRVSGSSTETLPLIDGVGVVTAKLPATLTLRAVDGTGATLAHSTVTEPDADGLLFGQPLLKRW